MKITGVSLVPGRAQGASFALGEPLSFWGGFDAGDGRVIDRRHPDTGRCLTGRIVVVSAARGSSSGSSVLAEAIRAGTAPAAFVVSSRDAILTVGAMVAAQLYERRCPIVMVSEEDLARIAASPSVEVDADATRAVVTID